ncbi:Tox-REase-5 domain-containing protein, partial [Enterobacter cloacae]
MVMIPPVVIGGTGGAAAGSVGMAGSTGGASTFPGAGSHGGWEDEDMSYPGSGSAQSRSQGGFDYQGKTYDPILNDPMAVSAETHGDFWEDDMD